MKASDYLKREYARKFVPDEGGMFSATIDEFPGVFAIGSTPAEAYDNLEAAAEAWIEAELAAGRDIPAPTQAPNYSGKIALRVPRSLHQRAAEAAERDDVSLNQWLVYAISEHLGMKQISTGQRRAQAQTLYKPSAGGALVIDAAIGTGINFTTIMGRLEGLERWRNCSAIPGRALVPISTGLGAPIAASADVETNEDERWPSRRNFF
jgi:antitoxin HicB